MLAADFDLLEFAQRAKAHVQNCFGLIVGELETSHQDRLRFILGTNDADHLIEVEISDEIAAKDLEAPGNLGQAEIRAADKDDLAMVEPFTQHIAQRHDLRNTPLRQHVHVERNARFELGIAEQLLHQKLRIDGTTLRLEHDTDVLRRFIPEVGEQRQLLRRNKLGDPLDQPALLDLIGNFGDDDLPGAAAEILLAPAGADAERAAAALIGIEERGAVIDNDAARRKVRPWHQLHQLVDRRIGEFDQMQRRIAELGGIVRGDGCRHADGNAG